MDTSLTPEKTLFQEEAEEYQEEQKRTKSTGLRDALYWVGFCTLGLVLIIIILRLFPEKTPAILMIMIPVCAAGILYGLYGIISSTISPTIQVTCPKCGTVHEIFKKERLYMCTDCGTLLNMGKDVDSPIEFVTCPYCDHQAAVSRDHGPLQCYNCGITHSPTTTVHEWETTKCPSCEELVPIEAFYCKHCGHLLKPLPSYEMDWKVGKDAHGHFHFARMLLATFPAKEAALAARLSSDELQSGQRPWTAALDEMRVLLESLGEVQKSLEEALQEPELRAPVEGLMPEIDFLYARLLALELKAIVWAKGPENQALRVKTYGPSYFEIFERGGPQIRARKRLELIPGLESLQSAGSISPWDDGHLVSTVRDQGAADYADPTKPSTYELVGYAGLQAEAEWTFSRTIGYCLRT
jgi:ssDNA-binding Zn-finger/Zn-ribbon topoisomerase 1